MKVIGLDLSRVIIEGHAKHHPDFLHNGNLYLPGALTTVSAIVREYGAESVFVVSRVKTDNQDGLVRSWLRHHGFHRETGVLEEHVLLCRERADKRRLCEKHGINVFVDDRLEVLGALGGVVAERYLFQGRKKEIRRHECDDFRWQLDRAIIRVQSWEELSERLLPWAH